MRVTTSALPDTSFNRRLEQGHESRTGHKADFRICAIGDGKLWYRVRLCCGDTVKDSYPAWEETV